MREALYKLLAISLMAFSAMALAGEPAHAALEVGDELPGITLADRAGQLHRIDAATSTPIALIFLKPDDRYTEKALAAIAEIYRAHPELNTRGTQFLIVTRLEIDGGRLPELPIEFAKWTLLLDSENEAYRAFKIIATPTMMVSGSDSKIVVVHTGYDPNLTHDLRMKLAPVYDLQLPSALEHTPAAPDMNLQLARRMASRGMWEKALDYYAKVENPSAECALEVAQTLMELERWTEALEKLQEARTLGADENQAAALEEVIKAGPATPAASSKP